MDDAIIYIQMSLSQIETALNEARAAEERLTNTSRAMDEALNSFFQGVDVGILEDYFGFGYLEIPKRVVKPGSGESGSSLKLENQFTAPSMDLDRKKTVMLIVPTNTSMLFGPVGVASYLCSLVTKKDQV